jgi:methyl-accepting chemotaxis protein
MMKLSLTAKILLAAFLALTVTMALSQFVLLSRQESAEHNAARQQAEVMADLIIESLVFSMAEGLSDFRPFAQRAETVGQTRELRIISTDHLVEGGNERLDGFERRAYANKQPQLEEEIYKGEPVIRIARPILATQTCLDCHGGELGQPFVVVSLRTSTAEMQQNLAEQRLFAVLFALGTIALTLLLLGYIVKSRIVKVIRRCVDFSKQIAVGDLTGSLAVHSSDETGELADAFRTLQQNLERKAGEARAIARGDLQVHVEIDSDEDTLGQAMVDMIQSLRGMQRDLSATAESLQAGQLDSRCSTERLEGAYADLLQSVNRALDTVTSPILDTVEILGEYGRGRLDREIRELPGQLGQLTQGLGSIRSNLRSLIEETGELAEAAESGNLRERGDAAEFEGGYRQLVEGFNRTLDRVLAPIEEAVGCLRRMADGDLSTGVSGDYQGDHALMKEALNATLRSLNELLGHVITATEQVSSGAQQVSSASHALSQGAISQASSLEEISSSMQELEDQTRRNAEDSRQAADGVGEVRRYAEGGRERMAHMMEAMGEINESSDRIGQIIKVIEEIAFQTNLLALNAAVEAARAGQHGKGFAVVADEVRQLAQRSAKAASETTELIEGSRSRVARGTTAAEETREQLEQIFEGVERITGLVQGISEASYEQSQGIQQITESLNSVESVTQSNSANAEQSASAAEELTGQAAELKEMLGQFTLASRVRARIAEAAESARKGSTGGGQPQGGASTDRRQKRLEEPPAPQRGTEVGPDELLNLDDGDFSGF